MEDGTPADNPANTNPNADNPAEIDYEKRYKDTQAAYTKSQQALKHSEAENGALKTLVPTVVTKLSPEKQEELEELKYSDPEAWRVELNKAEAQARTDLDDRTKEVLSKATSDADIQFELSRRATILEEHNTNSQNPITDDVLANDIPPRIKGKLERGEISFEDFLTEIDTYLGTPKAVANEEILGQPNLGTKSGGNNPSEIKAGETVAQSYEKTIF